MTTASAKIGTKPLVGQTVLDLICNTPLVKINKLTNSNTATLYGKLESMNPGGSVKDRICFSMICDAEEKGLIKQDTLIVEPTSGNTGIGLALVCAVKGYRLILTMPDTMSIERRQLLKRYGAELVLTPGAEGMKGAIAKAQEIAKENDNSFIPQQFANPANPKIHRERTAEEIWTALDGKVDAFVSGVGTGGTITGCGEVFKKRNPNVKIVAVEPKNSPVLSGGSPGKHKIQGIGAGFVPDVMNRQIVDQVITVDDQDAWQTALDLAKREGILSGISSGAILWAALQVCKELGPGKNVVAIICDTGERYLSMDEAFKQ
ncbi:MAG: cysteine synthase A [Candidatus Omnitrophica bacterium]|nr:cysteine synthase A [Candidatus Omnitrophota bacterium]